MGGGQFEMAGELKLQKRNLRARRTGSQLWPATDHTNCQIRLHIHPNFQFGTVSKPWKAMAFRR